MSYQPKSTNERILHRLKIARGHLAKVIKMVEEQEYCIDVLLQSRAIQSALKEADNLLLEHHLKTCAVDHIKKGKTNEAVEEVMEVFRKKA